MKPFLALVAASLVAAAWASEATYDCEAGAWNWIRGWSEAKQEWCCQHQRVGCQSRSYDCSLHGASSARSWAASQRFWCCQHEDVGCEEDYDCSAGYGNWQRGWSESKQRWCCQKQQRGCTKDNSSQYNCNAGSGQSSELELWPAGQALWCCQHWGVGCAQAERAAEAERGRRSTSTTPKRKEGFDCSAGLMSDTSDWPEVQRAWCCVSEGVACEAATTPRLFDCQAGLLNWEQGWSKKKISWCCLNEGLGCRAPRVANAGDRGGKAGAAAAAGTPPGDTAHGNTEPEATAFGGEAEAAASAHGDAKPAAGKPADGDAPPGAVPYGLPSDPTGTALAQGAATTKPEATPTSNKPEGTLTSVSTITSTAAPITSTAAPQGHVATLPPLATLPPALTLAPLDSLPAVTLAPGLTTASGLPSLPTVTLPPIGTLPGAHKEKDASTSSPATAEASGTQAPRPTSALELILATQRPYDCGSGTEEWSVEQRDWCCENKDLGCTVTITSVEDSEPPYDCQGGEEVQATWSDEEADWCCDHKDVGCPEVASTTRDASALLTAAVTTSAPASTSAASTAASTTAAAASLRGGAAAGGAAAGAAAGGRHHGKQNHGGGAAASGTAARGAAAGGAAEGAMEGAGEGASRLTDSLAVDGATTPAPPPSWNVTKLSPTTTGSPLTSCWEQNVRYDPLDMFGTVVTQENGARECQERCGRTMGCAHFSFYTLGGDCHLGNEQARPNFAAHFSSGPPTCEQSASRKPPCYEVMTVYFPTMPGMGVSYKNATSMKAKDVAKACKQRCFQTEGCAHYVVQFPQRTCELAGPNANKVAGMRAVSGPPFCNRTANVLRKFASQPLAKTPPARLLTAFAAAGAGLLALTAAGAWALRQGSRSGTCRRMLVRSRRPEGAGQGAQKWKYSALGSGGLPLHSADCDDEAGPRSWRMGESAE